MEDCASDSFCLTDENPGRPIPALGPLPSLIDHLDPDRGSHLSNCLAMAVRGHLARRLGPDHDDGGHCSYCGYSHSLGTAGHCYRKTRTIVMQVRELSRTLSPEERWADQSLHVTGQFVIAVG